MGHSSSKSSSKEDVQYPKLQTEDMEHSCDESLPKKDIEYLEDNTKFSTCEIIDSYRKFMKQNPDGYITKEQFLEMTSSFSSTQNSNVMNEHLFRAADKDGTGKIDFKEMILMLNLRFTDDPKERLGWVFDLYDIDGNGSIEREEMIKIFTLMLSATSNQGYSQQQEQEAEVGDQKQQIVLTPESVTNTVFEFCDVDKNGSISKEEFIAGGLKDPNLVQFLGGIAGK